MQQLDSIADVIFAELAQQPASGSPPLHLWSPASQGPMDMQIKSNGDWLFQGSEIRRAALVKLFASILRREEDGEYYLVTPHEKFQISVDDAPFVVVDAEVSATEGTQNIYLRTNVDDFLMLGEEHPLEMRNDQPYVKVRDALWALLGRNVFYRLVERAEERTIDEALHMVLCSAGAEFSIGETS